METKGTWMAQLALSYHLYPASPGGDDSDWSDGDSAKGKIPDVQVKIEIKNNASLQAVCNAPTPLGPAYPRGLFGAIDLGQEEAVKFYQAWKAEVVLNIKYLTFLQAI